MTTAVAYQNGDRDSNNRTDTAKPRSAHWLMVGPPIAVIVVVILGWLSALMRAGFWADDFTNLTLYGGGVGDLSDTARNDGKYTINFFWWLGSVAFGNSVALPFLLVVGLTTMTGVALWLRSGIGRHWSGTQAWWIAGALCATATPLGVMLWSSNIVHAVSFLCLAVALAAHNRAVSAPTPVQSLLWSAAGAGAWLLLIVSNPLYLGALTLAVLFAWRESRSWIVRATQSSTGRRLLTTAVFGAQVGIPSLYFLLIAYPRTTSRSSYSTFGLGEVRGNVAFYIGRLAPMWWERWTYVALVVAATLLALRCVKRDLLPIALVTGAFGIALPVFMQGQQRADHYLAIPALLLFSAIAVALPGSPKLRPTQVPGWAEALGLIAASFAIVAIFAGSGAVRSWWVATPLGSQIAQLRQEIAAQTVPGESVCLRIDMDSAEAAVFKAGIAGGAALRLPPVEAGHVTFDEGSCCADGSRAIDVTLHGASFYASVPNVKG